MDIEKKVQYNSIKYIVKDKVKAGNQEVETQEVKTCRSPIELKLGEQLVEVRVFFIDGKTILKVDGIPQNLERFVSNQATKAKG
jgi:hypothetical protein